MVRLKDSPRFKTFDICEVQGTDELNPRRRIRWLSRCDELRANLSESTA